MAIWLYTLDFSDFWEDGLDDIEDTVKRTVSKIRSLANEVCDDHLKEELESMADEFEIVDDVDAYDWEMNNLYDLSDAYRIWVKTIF